QGRAAHPHRRRGSRDGREPRLPHPAAVRRGLRGRLGAGRGRRRALGHVPAKRRSADRRPGQHPAVHRDHHRRARLDRRLLRRRAARRPGRQLHRLPRAQGGAVLEHRPDGADPAVATAGPVPCGAALGAGMLARLLSTDYPRSRIVAFIVIAVVLLLALAPFLFPGAKAANVATKILVFTLLVASFDLLLGYTGIVSFAHTMFFGVGAYGVAIMSTRMGPGWDALAVGLLAGLVVSGVLALVIGLFSLRVRAIFFAMITLAVAAAFQTLASQLHWLTGGEDGLTFRLPRELRPAFELFETPIFGQAVDGRMLGYY